MQIKLIFSFEEREQLIEELEFTSPPSEAEFVFRALSMLNDSERSELLKISACQIVDCSSSALPWIIESNGKYSFVNEDCLKERLSSAPAGSIPSAHTRDGKVFIAFPNQEIVVQPGQAIELMQQLSIAIYMAGCERGAKTGD